MAFILMAALLICMALMKWLTNRQSGLGGGARA